MRTFSAILLVLLFFVLFFGGSALAAFGFGAGFGWFPAPDVLHVLTGVPGIAIGVVGVILGLAGLGVAVYISMKYPELRSYGSGWQWQQQQAHRHAQQAAQRAHQHSIRHHRPGGF